MKLKILFFSFISFYFTLAQSAPRTIHFEGQSNFSRLKIVFQFKGSLSLERAQADELVYQGIVDVLEKGPEKSEEYAQTLKITWERKSNKWKMRALAYLDRKTAHVFHFEIPQFPTQPSVYEGASGLYRCFPTDLGCQWSLAFEGVAQGKITP
ncbi:MAG: hypothetical protein AB7F59_04250 [Bdellovibrionales bacterium]